MAEDVAPAQRCVTSRLRVALGTFVAVDAQARTPQIGERAIAAAFDAIATVERTMHPRREGSDLAVLAASPPGDEVQLHAWTWEVLQLCRRLHTATGGAFDPCLADAPGRMGDLELIEPRRVRPHARLQIDLGAIAKGYAVDRALDALRAAGCEGGLVNAGGDLAVFGERCRTVVCRTTRGTWAIELSDAALASSDTDERMRPAEHRGYYHGLDRSAVVRGQVTVTASRAVMADALATCVLLCGRAQSELLLAQFDAREVHCPGQLRPSGDV
jgi:thiamine biosynthesis lipoprotein